MMPLAKVGDVVHKWGGQHRVVKVVWKHRVLCGIAYSIPIIHYEKILP